MRKTVEQRFWEKVDKTISRDGCWIWTAGRDSYGYGHFHLGGQAVRAHILSYRWHFGEIPAGLCVLHHCDNPLCVNPRCLFLGSRADNVADMDAKGRRINGVRPLGGKHPLAKLSEKEIPIIRQLLSQGKTLAQVASIYGVCVETVRKVRLGLTWGHVP